MGVVSVRLNHVMVGKGIVVVILVYFNRAVLSKGIVEVVSK